MANVKKIKVSNFKFQPFSEKQLKLLSFWQEGSPVRDKFMVVADGSIRSGKEQPNSSIVYTTKGKKKMGEIKVGDYVFNRLGQPKRVSGVYPQGVKEIYKLTFNDGAVTRCGLEHLWPYYTVIRNKPVEERNLVIRPLKELKNMSYRDFRFPMCKKVEFNLIEPEYEPNFLSLVMGYGIEKRNGNWIISTDRAFVHQGIQEVFPEYKPSYIGSFGMGRLEVDIKEEIIYTPIEYREELVRCMIKNKGFIYIDTVELQMQNKEMVNIFIEILRSLGLFVERDRRNPNFRIKIKINQRLLEYISPEMRARCLEINKTSVRILSSIEPAGKEECTCIMVEDEEHLYLTDDYIVTHNTVSMTLSFILYVMNTFNEANAAICGKSVGTVRRNIIPTLKQMMETIGFTVIEHRSENYLEIAHEDVVNYFFIFGASDEASQDYIQGGNAVYRGNSINN